MPRRCLNKMIAKYLIFDSGTLINITQNCLINMFRKLQGVFKGGFVITPTVKYESIEHPIKIKRYQWGAIRVQSLIEEGLIKMIEDEQIVDYKTLSAKTNEVMELVNNSYFSEGKSIHLIEKGEAECMALSLLLSAKGIDNAAVIEERTARMICENPENLKKLMEEKLEIKLEVKYENLKAFQRIKVLRSTELVYLAYKMGLADGDKKTLEAMLYALKFGGCSISEKEVQFLKKA
jgi:hypothetical protein